MNRTRARIIVVGLAATVVVSLFAAPDLDPGMVFWAGVGLTGVTVVRA